MDLENNKKAKNGKPSSQFWRVAQKERPKQTVNGEREKSKERYIYKD